MVTQSRLVTPDQPILFLAVGPDAVKSVQHLPQVAEKLGVEVTGPFGYVALENPGESPPADQVTLFTCKSVSDLPPADGDVPENLKTAALDEASVVPALLTITRGLRQDHPFRDSASAAKLSLGCYCLIDLSCPGVVSATLALLGAVRKAEPLIDVTGIALTGRTAKSEPVPLDVWSDSLEQLVDKLPRTNGVWLAQRLYILDGQDANERWLQDRQEMHRQAAEFMLHHGASPYRSHLRRSEVQQTSMAGSFLHVCGSFACVTLERDQVGIASAVGEELARAHLGDLATGALDKKQMDDLDAEAKSLARRLSKLACSDPTDVADEAKQTLQKTLARVCAKEPVLRLQCFLRSLKPCLEQLVAGASLVRRFERRYRAAERMDRERKSVYLPLRSCAGASYATWQNEDDPYSVTYVAGPTVRVTHPASPGWFIAGLAMLCLAVLTVVAPQVPWLWSIAAGPLAILGSAVMARPRKWSESERQLYARGERPPRGRAVAYRLKPPPWAVTSAAALAVGAAAAYLAVLRALSVPVASWRGPMEWNLIMPLLLCGAGLGIGLVLMAMPGRLPRRASVAGVNEAPEMAPLPFGVTWWVGAVLAAAGWVALTVLGSGMIVPQGVSGRIACGVAMLLLVVAVGLVRWPRQANAVLTQQVRARPRRPEPLPTLEEAPAQLARQIDRILPWCESLLHMAADSRPETQHQWPASQPAGCILDIVAHDWRRQLVRAFHADRRDAKRPSLADEAKSGDKWAECLIKELEAPTVGLSHPAVLFATHAAREWWHRRQWAQRVKDLRPDNRALDSFVNRFVAPRWPSPRGEATSDASVIVLPRALCELLSNQVKDAPNHRLYPVDLREQEAVTAVRIVQGLEGGWPGGPSLDKVDRRAPIHHDREVGARIHDLIAAAEEIPRACREDMLALDDPRLARVASRMVDTAEGEIAEAVTALSLAPHDRAKGVDRCNEAIGKLVKRLGRLSGLSDDLLPGPKLADARRNYGQRLKDVFTTKLEVEDQASVRDGAGVGRRSAQRGNPVANKRGASQGPEPADDDAPKADRG